MSCGFGGKAGSRAGHGPSVFLEPAGDYHLAGGWGVDAKHLSQAWIRWHVGAILVG